GPSSFFFQAEDGIRDGHVTGVQTCALPISGARRRQAHRAPRHRMAAARAIRAPGQRGPTLRMSEGRTSRPPGGTRAMIAKDGAREELTRWRERLVALSHRIHANPEVAFEEEQSARWTAEA